MYHCYGLCPVCPVLLTVHCFQFLCSLWPFFGHYSHIDCCCSLVQVWPYLLGHYKFKSSPQERATLDETIRTQYERIMSEWLAVEAIVRQRDKEVVAANLAKLSQVCDCCLTKLTDLPVFPLHLSPDWPSLSLCVCVCVCVCVCTRASVRVCV